MREAEAEAPVNPDGIVKYPKKLFVPLETTKYGWNGFLHMHLELHFKVKDVCEEPVLTDIVDAFRKGNIRSAEVSMLMTKVAVGFSSAFIDKLKDAGYRIGWYVFESEARLKGGKRAGPGVALYLCAPEEADGGRVRVDVEATGAVALGNAMGFCQDGVRVSVEGLHVGIVAGGPIYEAFLAHKRGDDRLLSETLGLGRDSAVGEIAQLQMLCTRLEAVQKDWRAEFTDEEWQRWHDMLEKVGKQITRRINMVQVRDDVEVWETIKEELGSACPMFGRMQDDQKAEIFRRIKVRLGLAEDE